MVASGALLGAGRREPLLPGARLRLERPQAALEDVHVACGELLEPGQPRGGRARVLLRRATGLDLLLQRAGVGAA